MSLSRAITRTLSTFFAVLLVASAALADPADADGLRAAGLAVVDVFLLKKFANRHED